MKSILVIGSSNTDLVIRVPSLPLPGQTVLGGRFETFGGGKGANQAVAARRAGATVRFLGAVGDDDYGRTAIDNFAAEDIDTSLVQVIAGVPSGVATILVGNNGENSIAVAPGANARLSPDHLRRQSDLLVDTSLVLLQLEIPMDTVITAVELAYRQGTPCILNPAPAAALPDAVLKKLYCITPNETEAEFLTGMKIIDRESALQAAEALLQRGVRNVVITMGARGALLHNADETHHEKAARVTAVDTTAAGDTFNGVLAAMIAEGQSLRESVRLAVAAATRSVQTAGAIASIPRRSDFM
ncbi:MAG: ribokinase [Gammaproteobacteria bacterium]|nr:ribokinase [Gammaproteobacteria bacterium]